MLRMHFQFHGPALRLLRDSSQAFRVVNRLHVVETVRCNKIPSHALSEPAPIPALHAAFFARSEGEWPAYPGLDRQQPLAKHIGTQMHMVMAVDKSRRPAVETLKFALLLLNHVPERGGEQRII